MRSSLPSAAELSVLAAGLIFSGFFFAVLISSFFFVSDFSFSLLGFAGLLVGFSSAVSLYSFFSPTRSLAFCLHSQKIPEVPVVSTSISRFSWGTLRVLQALLIASATSFPSNSILLGKAIFFLARHLPAVFNLLQLSLD
jgi:hypothetical protein